MEGVRGRLADEAREAPRAALEGTRTLYVSPDGVLATMPWGLLPDGGEFLVERVPVVCVSGGAGLVMAARTTREASGEGLLALGDVDYSGLDRAVPALPATKDEADHVAERFREYHKLAPCRTLTGREASKTAFSAETGKARYVHVATHGFFDLENLGVACAGTRGFSGEKLSASMEPTRDRPDIGSGNPLLLSGTVLAPTEDGDGWLTAEDLQDLDLRGVELVVLSACETGRGELAAGEGVLGLSRALFVAGARGFLLSLWKVPDRDTRELMDAFYEGLWGKSLTPEEALRQAQMHMLARDREMKRFRPSAWGAWVLLK